MEEDSIKIQVNEKPDGTAYLVRKGKLGIIVVDENSGTRVEDFWLMCAELYKAISYQNNVNIKIKGQLTGTVTLKVRPNGGN
jgi:hypothetical protein